MSSFDFPAPRSQRFPEINRSPLENLLMVSRQLLLQSPQRVLRVLMSKLSSAFSSRRVEASPATYRSFAIKAAPKAPIIPEISGRMASRPDNNSNARKTASL